jgi:catechol 2,3-dioxygenase-like lactoylglutathione lyase family enzyme
MNNLYARSVFFVKDTERSLRFYMDQLGFSEDWTYQEDDRTVVFQVSLFGFELILNEIGDRTETRAGLGRTFIGLEDGQVERVREHFAANNIAAERVHWGRPTLVVRDLDKNELFFWLPRDDFAGFEIPASESSAIAAPAIDKLSSGIVTPVT